ncbi:MAG: CopD family protein [Chlamydiia bacterium]|nr:CopD family protein [Chlamydiia bacterium]
MAIIKMLHVLCVFIWVGNLLMLSRFMGYHVKEDEGTQLRMAALYRRMYYFIGMPTMCLAVFFGLILLSGVDLSYKPGWFHMKLTFILVMIVLDTMCGRMVSKLSEAADRSRGIKYKIFHGVTGLTLIAILVSLYVVRDRDGEVLHRVEGAQIAARSQVTDPQNSWQK